MEYYQAFKRKEILTHDIMWMNLEDMMPSEISQMQKEHILHDSTSMSYQE